MKCSSGQTARNIEEMKLDLLLSWWQRHVLVCARSKEARPGHELRVSRFTKHASNFFTMLHTSGFEETPLVTDPPSVEGPSMLSRRRRRRSRGNMLSMIHLLQMAISVLLDAFGKE